MMKEADDGSLQIQPIPLFVQPDYDPESAECRMRYMNNVAIHGFKLVNRAFCVWSLSGKVAAIDSSAVSQVKDDTVVQVSAETPVVVAPRPSLGQGVTAAVGAAAGPSLGQALAQTKRGSEQEILLLGSLISVKKELNMTLLTQVQQMTLFL